MVVIFWVMTRELMPFKVFELLRVVLGVGTLGVAGMFHVEPLPPAQKKNSL